MTMCWLYDFTSLSLTSMDLDVYGAEIWKLFQAFEEFWVIRSSGVYPILPCLAAALAGKAVDTATSYSLPPPLSITIMQSDSGGAELHVASSWALVCVRGL